MDDGAVVVQCETGRDSDFGVDVDVDVDFDVDSDVRCPMAISDGGGEDRVRCSLIRLSNMI